MTIDGTAISIVVGSIATLMGGVWALLNKQNSQNEKQTTAFLTHLEKKNGHTERIAQRFTESVNALQSEIAKANENTARAIEHNVNIASVLNNAAKALREHHEHITKKSNEN